MVGRRSPTSYYSALPQAPIAVNAPESLEVDGEDEELLANESVQSTEVAASIWWVHFILGCVVLLPWNALITATPYFISRLQGSPLQNSFSSYLSLIFTTANFGFLIHSTATAKQASPSRRILLGASAITTSCALLTFSTYFHPLPGVFFSYVIITAIIMAGCGSYVQTSIVAVASLFGPNAMQAVMSGQGGVGVVVSLVQVLGAAANVNDSSVSAVSHVLSDEEDKAEVKSAFLFFGLSSLFLLCGIGAHTWMITLPAYKARTAPLERPKISRRSSSADESEGLVSGVVHEPPMKNKDRIWRVAKANAIYNFTVFYVFVVTLSVFPPITISVHSTNPAAHPLLFSAIHFLVFNVGDFSGRGICSWSRVVIWSSKKLLAISLSRTLFIPLFLLCNVQRPSSGTPIAASPVISSDFVFMLILFFFGFSNGWICSLAMMAAPSIEHNPKLKGRREDVDVAATVGSFCIVAGLAFGSLTSFAVRAAVCQCNPFS